MQDMTIFLMNIFNASSPYSIFIKLIYLYCITAAFILNTHIQNHLKRHNSERTQRFVV
uniref:Uncharacterized protein n=1 Tax=Lepeophtheirus salmonis TaxID=72036 RepID=A0A0K2T5C7_LEPSM